MSHFNEYSRYYDLLYKDKDYKTEVDYIDKLIRNYASTAKSLLDIGCGTGKHANLMHDKGYQTKGIDLSESMLNEAQRTYGHKISFSQGDIRDFKLDQKFDVITSLFHVMSYQTLNEDLYKSLNAVYNHLNEGGYFIFDCWYGPGVLNDPPKVRIKRMHNDQIDVVRIAEPVMHHNECVIDVNFEINIKDKQRDSQTTLTEVHPMRYLFKNEIEMLCDKFSFQLIDYFGWQTFNKPAKDDWYAVFILKK